MRAEKISKAKSLLVLARERVAKEVLAGTVGDLPENSVLSYIDRNLGICSLMEQKLQAQSQVKPNNKKQKLREAGTILRRALQILPTNSTTYYALGCCIMQEGELEEAVRCMLRAVILDPDFKQAYQVLGNCLLRLGRFQEAVEAGRACLCRHVD